MIQIREAKQRDLKGVLALARHFPSLKKLDEKFLIKPGLKN
jgi:hypothetical protein